MIAVVLPSIKFGTICNAAKTADTPGGEKENKSKRERREQRQEEGKKKKEETRMDVPCSLKRPGTQKGLNRYLWISE